MGFIPWSLKINKLCPLLLQGLLNIDRKMPHSTFHVYLLRFQSRSYPPTHCWSVSPAGPLPGQDFLLLFKQKPLIILIYLIHPCVLGVHMPLHVCGGQKTALRSRFSPSIIRDSGIEPRTSGCWQVPFHWTTFQPLGYFWAFRSSNCGRQSWDRLEALFWWESLGSTPSFFHGNNPHLCNLLVLAW